MGPAPERNIGGVSVSEKVLVPVDSFSLIEVGCAIFCFSNSTPTPFLE